MRRFAALLLLGAVACGGGPEPVGTLTVERVQRSLVLAPEAARAARSAPGRSVEDTVRVDTLAPSKRRDLDTSPLPCWEVGVGSEVEVDLGPLPPGASLRLAAGFGSEAYAGEAQGTVRFRVALDGRECFLAEKPYGAGVRADERAWSRPKVEGAAPGELPLAGARTLRLVTEAAAGSGQPPAAFGLLEVVTREERAHLPAAPNAPNVVLVVIDTLRADRVGHLGHAGGLTPRLDGLAARGTSFRSAWTASPWTWPSTASLLTGLGPQEHGVLSYESCYLAQSLVTLGEHLQDGGWATAAFSSNPLVQPDKQFDQGFGTFRSYAWAHGAEVAGDAAAWIEAQAAAGAGRWFAYVHLTDPHEYVPSPEFRDRVQGEYLGSAGRDELYGLLAKRLQGLAVDEARLADLLANQESAYDATVAEADAALGRLIDAVSGLGLTDRTLFVVTSDHGEEFLDHGLLYHGSQLHEELVRAPLVLAGPSIPAGVAVDAAVENRTTFHRILAATGLAEEPAPPPPGAPRFFTTSLGVVRTPGSPTSVNREVHGVRTGRSELFLWAPERGDEPAWTALYDLAADPRALDPVAEPDPERVAALQDLLARWIQAGLEVRPEGVGGGAATRSALDAMGYTR
jgi:arylsulfatase A-like enzyme